MRLFCFMAYRTWSTVNNSKIGEYVTREKWPVTAYEDFTPWPCVWEKSFISLPCIRQGTLSYGSFFFTIHILIHRANSFFGKKKNIADTTNIDQWSPTFTFFDWSRVQKDALFKVLNSETVYPANYTLLGSQKHITLNTVFGPMRSAPNSSGHARVFCPTCIHSMWGKSLIWVKAKMQSNNNDKNWGKLVIRYPLFLFSFLRILSFVGASRNCCCKESPKLTTLLKLCY